MKKYSLKTKSAYGCGDMFAGGAFLLIGLLFLNFLTDIVMISPALAGAIFLVGKIWDAVSDPLMGVISDRTESRFGRRRVYFLAGIFPIFFAFSLLWFSWSGGSETGRFFFYLFAYLLFNTVFTMVMIPYNSILPAMTTDYQERSRFTTVRLMFSSFSSILSGVLPMIIINSFGQQRASGYLVMGLIFGAIYALPWIFVFKGTWEERPEQTEKPPFNIKHTYMEFAQAFKNRSFRQHIGFFVSAQTAVDFLTSLFIYYLTYCLNRAGSFSMVLGTLLVVQLLSMPVHMQISKRFGKTAPLKFGIIAWSAALLLSLTLSESSPVFWIFIVSGISGIGTSASIFVPWSILPEISDVDELITGRRREGIYSGMMTFVRKIAQALSVFLIGVFLELLGYIPGAVQSPGTQLGIKILFSIVPIAFLASAFFFAGRYRMTEDKYEIMMGQVEKQRKGEPLSDDPEIQAVCRELTGQELFKNQ